MKKYKGTNNELQNIHIKLKIEQHEPHYKRNKQTGATIYKTYTYN